MKNKISKDERIFVAGAKGMAGSAICRSLVKKGYGLKENDGNLFTPSRNDLDLLCYESVINWFKKNKPSSALHIQSKPQYNLRYTKNIPNKNRKRSRMQFVITTHYPVTIIQPSCPQSVVTHSKFTKLKLLHFQQTLMGTCTPIQQYTDPPTHTTQTIFNFNASTASNIYHNIYPIKTTIISPLYVLCIPSNI